jgi:predicted nucleotidyltransferase
MERVELEHIRRFAADLAAKYKPERIILFGSHARGRARRDSDVDLLVVMAHVRRPARKSAEMLVAIAPSFPVDLIVRSRRDVRDRIRDGDFFLRDIFEHGEVLHEASRA